MRAWAACTARSAVDRAGVGGDRTGKSGAHWELDGVQAVRRGAGVAAAGSRILTIPIHRLRRSEIIWMRCQKLPASSLPLPWWVSAFNFSSSSLRCPAQFQGLHGLTERHSYAYSL